MLTQIRISEVFEPLCWLDHPQMSGLVSAMTFRITCTIVDEQDAAGRRIP